MGTTTRLVITSQCTVVEEASPAPVRPPMRACEDEEGRPNHHVTRFHAIAPANPASTTTSPEIPSGGVMMPEPITSATPVPSIAPIRFITAAMATATRGVSARVEMDVATALAASWNPFVKAKPRATTTTVTTTAPTGSTLRTP